MNLPFKNRFYISGILMSLLVGCASPIQSVTPPSESIPATETITAPEPTIAPSPKADKPTYSEVVGTYPAGVNLCKTEASLEGISANGSWLLNGDIQIIDNQMQVKCYGTKITVNVEGGDLILDGVIYAKGALLTVDKDLNWIEVSSWE